MADSQPPDEIVELVTNADRDKFAVSLQLVARHMTAAAVQGETEIARQTYGLPAQESTKREIEKTKQTYAVVAGGVALGVGALIIAAVKLKDTPLAWVLIAVAGIFAIGGAAPKIIEAIKKKPE